MSHPFALSQYDFELPPERIAQAPARPRDSSRLLLLPRAAGAPLMHCVFRCLPQLLRADDLLVVNRTEVMPARLRLRRPTGGRVELLLHRPVDGPRLSARTWEGLGRPASALRPGSILHTADGTALRVVARRDEAVQVAAETPIWPLLQALGELPLPPYLRRPAARPEDAADYRHLFAREPGAVAAPTASLHFTEDTVAALAARGIERAEVVLHVGPGTFLPVRPEHGDDVRRHSLHAEPYEIPAAAAAAIEAARRAGRRVIAVGTTVVRALEAWHHSGSRRGDARLFILPGFEFGVVDGLVTNFHLPRSTLLMLVAALCGRARLLAAYRAALAEGYRFYSYGDAMLVL